MLGSRSKALLSCPLPMAGVFLGAFVTLSAPSHPPLPQLSVLAQAREAEAGAGRSEGWLQIGWKPLSRHSTCGQASSV